jgi:hypothetical protein
MLDDRIVIPQTSTRKVGKGVEYLQSTSTEMLVYANSGFDNHSRWFDIFQQVFYDLLLRLLEALAIKVLCIAASFRYS